MNKYNRYHLLVLTEIKSDPYFYKENNAVMYRVPRSKDGMNKVTAVWDLIDFGAFKKLNQERFDLDYEFSLIINHSVFDAIYESCVENTKRKTLEQYEQQIQNRSDRVVLGKKIRELIKLNKLGSKQSQLLLLLSDFKKHNTDELNQYFYNKKKPTTKLRALVRDTNNKIRHTAFRINSIASGFINTPNSYSLSHLTATNTN